MKVQTILVAEGSRFSGGTMGKIPENGSYQNPEMDNGRQTYSSLLQRSLFIALILFLLVLFVIRFSAAQGPAPRMSRPNLGTESRETCWESLSPSLTEGQLKTFEVLRRAYMAESRPIRTELGALRVQLRYLFSDPHVEPRALFDQQRKISALQARLEELALSYQVKARSALTKEQLDRLPQGWELEMGLGHGVPFRDTGRRSRKGLQ
jgi:Spy/CpxP family protein refolding chaperone